METFKKIKWNFKTLLIYKNFEMTENELQQCFDFYQNFFDFKLSETHKEELKLELKKIN